LVDKDNFSPKQVPRFAFGRHIIVEEKIERFRSVYLKANSNNSRNLLMLVSNHVSQSSPIAPYVG